MLAALHHQGLEAARDWGVETWSDVDWIRKFEEILGFYKNRAAKAAAKGKNGALADYRELLYGGLRNKYGVDPRTLSGELIAQQEETVAKTLPTSVQTAANEAVGKHETASAFRGPTYHLGDGVQMVQRDQSEAAESGQLEVTEWLSSIGLERYAPHLIAAGYDRLIFFQGMGDDEIDELASSSGMLRPHARVFKTAAQDFAAARLAESIDTQSAAMPPSVAPHTPALASAVQVPCGPPFAQSAVGESVEVDAEALGAVDTQKAPALQQPGPHPESVARLTDPTDGVPLMHITVRPRMLYRPCEFAIDSALTIYQFNHITAVALSSKIVHFPVL